MSKVAFFQWLARSSTSTVKNIFEANQGSYSIDE